MGNPIPDHFRPQPHPTKEIFRKNGVRYADLAAYLGCSIGSVQWWLSGLRQPPNEIESILFELADKCESRANQPKEEG
jgi:transcriptional regulator with XRE-family HTH domain